MENSLDELVAKLTKSKEQLKQVTRMLTQKPNNDTLKSLQKDLKRVIELTENLVKMKEAKAAENAADTKEKKENKPQPREWGVPKDEYVVGERCQAKYTDGRWYIAQITEIVPHPQGEEGKGFNVLFLEYGNEHVCGTKDMRTYVAPLPDEVKVGDTVRACWAEDGMFYKAQITGKNPNGNYAVEFTKYKNKADDVPLSDMQLVKERKKPLLVHVDKKGWTHVAAEPYIPAKLQPKPSDSKEEKDRKRIKTRQAKKRHRKLMKTAEQNNRQNSWLRFHKKGMKKSVKKFKGSLFKTSKSIFAAPEGIDGKVGVAGSGRKMTNFDERTHHHKIRKGIEEAF